MCPHTNAIGRSFWAFTKICERAASAICVHQYFSARRGCNDDNSTKSHGRLRNFRGSQASLRTQCFQLLSRTEDASNSKMGDWWRISMGHFGHLALSLCVFCNPDLVPTLTRSQCISVIIYRLTLHPLAKYSGPLLWRISIWPTVWACASGRRHLMLLDIHKKYGPVVRIGPNMLSFNTNTSVRTIYGPRHANLVKSEFHLTLDATISSPSVFALIDKDKHAFRRRVISYAFTESAMKEQGEFVLHHTHVLRDVLKEKLANGWTKVDMGDYMTWWGTDILSSLALGTSFSCLESPKHRDGIEIMRNATKFTYWVCMRPSSLFEIARSNFQDDRQAIFHSDNSLTLFLQAQCCPGSVASRRSTTRDISTSAKRQFNSV